MNKRRTPTHWGDIVWVLHGPTTLAIPYREHLRLLQGAPLGEFFQPLLLLRCTPSSLWRVPFMACDAVLAEIHEAPDGMAPRRIAMELLLDTSTNLLTS